MRFFCLVLPVIAVSVHAQSLLPIPQLPPAPSLPLSVNTNGYFVFSWPYDTMGRTQSLAPSNVPTDVRSGVLKMGTHSMGSWFLKSSGEVVIFYNTGGAGMGSTKLNLQNFFKTGIAKFYSFAQGPGPMFVGISTSGQIGAFYNTNVNSVTLPADGVEVVDIFPEKAGPSPSRIFISHHANGTLRAWHYSNDGQLTRTNHVVDQFSQIRSVDTVNGDVGLAVNQAGQVFGWSSVSSPLAIPAVLSSGVVQVSAPSAAAGEAFFYALKADGSIVAWDLTGTVRGLPTSFSGKIFVKIVNLEEGRAFALTREGQLLGWRDNAGAIEEFLLPSTLASGLKDIRGIFEGTVRKVLALNQQGGFLPVFSGPTAWAVDSSVPEGISSKGSFLDSVVYSTAGAGTSANLILSSDGDLAVQTYTGLSLDVLAKLVAEKILNISNNFGLATKTEVGGAVTQGVQQVLSAPSDYNLFTPQQVQAERTAGQNDVIANPNQWTLYTTNQIKAMVMGDLMLTRTNNGQFVLNYDIEQSDDLTNWAPYQAIAMPLTNLPTDKAFVRIKLKNQQ